MTLAIALAWCDPYPPVVDDEVPLRDALAALGATPSTPAWDAAIRWSDFDAVLLRCTWDYHERADQFLAWCLATSRVTRLVNGPEVVRWNLDKRYLAELERHGLPIADTIWFEPDATRDAIDQGIGEALRRGWTRCMLKPAIAANAWGTLRLDLSDPAAHALARAHLAKPEWGARPFLMQTYLSAVETEGELSVIVIDGVPTHGVRKVPARGDYRVQEDWGARDVPWEPEPAALELARRAFEVAREVTGEDLLYGRVDLLRNADGDLVLNELELVEPALFFRHGPQAATRLAEALVARVRGA